MCYTRMGSIMDKKKKKKTDISKANGVSVYTINKIYNQLKAESDAKHKLYNDVTQAIIEGHEKQTKGWKQKIVDKFNINTEYFVRLYTSYLNSEVYRDDT